MTHFTDFLTTCLQTGWAERTGWTLVHSLWQIAAITGVYAFLILLLRNRSASARYVVGCVAMGAMLVLPAVTYVVLPTSTVPELEALSDSTSVAATPLPKPSRMPREFTFAEPEAIAVDPPAAAPILAEDEAPTFMATLSSSLQHWTPWITAAWLIGVLLLSFRPLWGWLHVRRLKHHGLVPLSDPLQEICGNLATRLGVRRAVEFAQSAFVEVPTVVGYLKPMVLLPASALSGLSTSQIELILAHELAHVRRHDYLVNLVQTVVESLLFYHPGMWWVSSQIRRERENCCDDMALALGGSRADYVKALAQLEERRSVPAAALAASGGSLLPRARRLLGQPQGGFGYRHATAWLAGLVTIGLVAAVLAMNGVAQGDVKGAAKEKGNPGEAAVADAKDTRTGTNEPTLSIIDTSGKPIAGARVRFNKMVPINIGGRLDEALDKLATIGNGVSDAGGRVAIPAVTDPEVTGLYASSVEAPGYVSRGILHSHGCAIQRRRNGRWSDGSVVLLKSGVVKGRVLGPDGKPLAGAPLSITTSCEYSDYWHGPGEVPNSASFFIPNHFRAVSDENGEFRFEDVPPGKLYVFYPWIGPTRGIEGGKWTKWTKPGEQYPLPPVTDRGWVKSIELDEGERAEDVVVDLSASSAAVDGQVIDPSGRPVANASVRAVWKCDGLCWISFPDSLKGGRAKTDAEGRFHLTGLPPGAVAVASEHPDLESPKDPVAVELESGKTGRAWVVMTRNPKAETSAGRPPADEDPASRATKIVWDKPRGGWQAGAKLISTTDKVQPGDPVVVQLLLKNVKDESRTIVLQECHNRHPTLGADGRITMNIDADDAQVELGADVSISMNISGNDSNRRRHVIAADAVLAEPRYRVVLNTEGMLPGEYWVDPHPAFWKLDENDPGRATGIGGKTPVRFTLGDPGSVKFTQPPTEEDTAKRIYWGKPVSGLIVGMRLPRRPKQWRAGSQVGGEMLVRNVSDRAIRLEYEAPPSGGTLVHQISDGKLVSLALESRHITPLRVRPDFTRTLTLQPGEQALVAKNASATGVGVRRNESDETRFTWTAYLTARQKDIPDLTMVIGSGAVPFEIAGGDDGPSDDAPAPEQPDAPSGESEAKTAADQSDLDAMRAYAKALAAGDFETLEKTWEFQDDLDRQFAEKLARMFAKAKDMRVDLVSMQRLGEDALFACFLMRGGPERFAGGPAPLFRTFQRKDGRWRCSPPGDLRSMLGARTMAVDRIGRRALSQHVIALRLGPMDAESQIARIKAQAEAFARLAGPPYNL